MKTTDLEAALNSLVAKQQAIDAQLEKAKREITSPHLVAGSGVFAWSGTPSFSDHEIACQSGVYRYTGGSTTLVRK